MHQRRERKREEERGRGGLGTERNRGRGREREGKEKSERGIEKKRPKTCDLTEEGRYQRLVRNCICCFQGLLFSIIINKIIIQAGVCLCV